MTFSELPCIAHAESREFHVNMVVKLKKTKGEKGEPQRELHEKLTSSKFKQLFFFFFSPISYVKQRNLL